MKAASALQASLHRSPARVLLSESLDDDELPSLHKAPVHRKTTAEKYGEEPIIQLAAAPNHASVGSSVQVPSPGGLHLAMIGTILVASAMFIAGLSAWRAGKEALEAAAKCQEAPAKQVDDPKLETKGHFTGAILVNKAQPVATLTDEALEVLASDKLSKEYGDCMDQDSESEPEEDPEADKLVGMFDLAEPEAELDSEAESADV